VSTEGWPAPDELEEIFRRGITPELLAGAVPQENPRAILLGGQPGVGKSSAKGTLHEELAGVGGAVDFSADLMRPYHPRFDDLLHGDERLLGDLDSAIDRDVRMWVDKALACVIDRRVNVIFDSNLANPERAGNIVGQFAAASYSIEVMFVAGASPLSRLGVLDRYQKQIEQQGFGAYCPPEIQDRNYQGVLESAALIDTGEIRVDAVHVYRRGDRHPIYLNRRGELGDWVDMPGARQAIVNERERPWSDAESSLFVATAESLAGRVADQYLDDLCGAVERADPLLKPEFRQTARELVSRLARRADPSPTKDAATADRPRPPRVIDPRMVSFGGPARPTKPAGPAAGRTPPPEPPGSSPRPGR
jgi:hypothetical protein